jgi:hypothetical protein
MSKSSSFYWIIVPILPFLWVEFKYNASFSSVRTSEKKLIFIERKAGGLPQPYTMA